MRHVSVCLLGLAVVGGLVGGVRRHRETQETVTTTRPNPDYEP